MPHADARPSCGHHRLRGADQSRHARLPALYRRLASVMAKTSRAFVCQACGAVTARWSGKCAACGEWNSHHRGDGACRLAGAHRHQRRQGPGGSAGFFVRNACRRRHSTRRGCQPASPSSTVCSAAGSCPARPCWSAATLASANRLSCLQAAAELANDRRPRRLSLGRGGDGAGAHARRASWARARRRSRSALRPISPISSPRLASTAPPALVVIDSVQTLWSESIEAAPGTISQLRGCASALISSR